MARRRATRKAKVTARVNPEITVDIDNLHAKIAANAVDQREAYLRGLPGEEQEAVNTKIDQNTWLDAEHVDVAISCLVAERAHLNKSVGIFPVYNADANLLIAENAAIDVMKASGRYPAHFAARPPLPEKSKIKNKDKLKERNDEEKRRDRLDREVNAKARAIVEHEGLNESLFLNYLTAISAKSSVLGNFSKKSMPFKDCKQLIIPLRINDNHYTVIVVKLEDSKGKKQKKATVQYYDSLDGDLDDDLSAQLIQFLTGKGYELEAGIENYSSADQREGYNCSIFASLGAIQLANDNAGNDEKFLSDMDGLSDREYKRLMDGHRQHLLAKLQSRGMNIELSDEYKKEIRQQHKQIRAESKQEQRKIKLNQQIIEMRDQLQNALNRVAGKAPVKRNVKKQQELLNLNPRVLTKECSELVQRLRKQQQLLKGKRDKTDAQKNNLKHIEKVLNAYAQNSGVFDQESRSFDNTASDYIAELRGWFTNLSFGNIALYGVLGAVGLYVAVPWVLLLFVRVAELLPTNSFFQVLAGASLFSGAAYLVSKTLGYVNESDREDKPSQDLDEDNDEDEENEAESKQDHKKRKPVTPMRDRQREEARAKRNKEVVEEEQPKKRSVARNAP